MILTRLTINFLINDGKIPETEGEQQNQFYCHGRGLSTLTVLPPRLLLDEIITRGVRDMFKKSYRS